MEKNEKERRTLGCPDFVHVLPGWAVSFEHVGETVVREGYDLLDVHPQGPLPRCETRKADLPLRAAGAGVRREGWCSCGRFYLIWGNL